MFKMEELSVFHGVHKQTLLRSNKHHCSIYELMYMCTFFLFLFILCEIMEVLLEPDHRGRLQRGQELVAEGRREAHHLHPVRNGGHA